MSSSAMKHVAPSLSFVWLMPLCGINYPQNHHCLLKIFHDAEHCVLSNLTQSRMLNALEEAEFSSRVISNHMWGKWWKVKA